MNENSDNGPSTITFSSVVERQPRPIISECTQIWPSDVDQCARFELFKHLEAALDIPEIGNSPTVRRELGMLILYFNSAFKFTPPPGHGPFSKVIDQKLRQEKSAAGKASVDARLNSPQRKEGKADWDRWANGAVSHKGTSNFIEAFIRKCEADPKLRENIPEFRTVVTWITDWRMHESELICKPLWESEFQKLNFNLAELTHRVNDLCKAASKGNPIKYGTPSPKRVADWVSRWRKNSRL